MKKIIEVYDTLDTFWKIMYIVVMVTLLYWTADFFVSLYTVIFFHIFDWAEIVQSILFVPSVTYLWLDFNRDRYEGIHEDDGEGIR